MPNRQVKSEKHLAFVRTHPCMVCANPNVDAHHLMRPWSGGRGMGMRAGDENAVPLCRTHHAELHTKFGDESKFFESSMGREDSGKNKARQLWYSSPAYRVIDSK